jgi:hypothetical protein
LIIDQPTQVYYPPEKTDELVEIEESSDEIAVRQMFEFIINVVKELTPNFQVIVTDHAYLKKDWFKDCVIETWRKGNKLIPEHWINQD